jgi:putative CocE/NonD family hydrolase
MPGPRVLRHIPVPLRDGVRLATSVFLPDGSGPWPTVLVRTAYNRVGMTGAEFTSRGMAFVCQDCRGRYGSEGEWYPFIHEGTDGLDALEWLHRQPWCDGRVGMFGDSYLAATQLHLAPLASDRLTALNPRFMAGDCWKQAYYSGGAFSLGLTWSWLCFETNARTSEAAMMPLFSVRDILESLPLLSLDERSGGGVVQAYRDYVLHQAYDDHWERINTRRELSECRAPMLLTGGWYDYYAGETFANYAALVQGAPTEELRRAHRVLVGPWTHGMSSTSALGELDFGPEALCEGDSTVRWLECLLKGGRPEDFQAAPIRLFAMGRNEWRDEWEWPLARTCWTDLYLRAGGGLSSEPPGDEPPGGYLYDPRDPVPTLGGNHSIGPYNPGLYEMAKPGPYDQRPVEARPDVLTYTTAPLPEDTEVTGPVQVVLFASSSARDTDFVARLCDVYPDGRSINTAEGILRARFREGLWDAPKLLEPGRVHEFSIDLQATSNVFAKGHCLRLDITSSSFPLWDRNLNTGGDPATDTEMQTAQQTIHHARRFPSHIRLPVVPER